MILGALFSDDVSNVAVQEGHPGITGVALRRFGQIHNVR